VAGGADFAVDLETTAETVTLFRSALVCRLRDTYAAWSNVLCHFWCSHGYWVGCRLFPSCQPMLAPTQPPEMSIHRGRRGATHPSSAMVAASTPRPNICQYQAVEPSANTVAPMGRALFFREAVAPLDVEAARYIIQFVSHAIN
jgi:hypothetical protein